MASENQVSAGSSTALSAGPPAPLFPEVGVLSLVPDRWHWQWQPRHQVMTRLARYFTVAWLNPANDWRQSVRGRKFLGAPEETPIAQSGFLVHTSSPFLPVVYRPGWLAKTLLRKRLERARGVLLSRGCKKIVLYLWRPDFTDALDLIPSDLVCYHIDDEYSFSDVEVPIPEREARLIAKADQVFIHSPALLEKKGKINPHTAFVPNGVDFLAYARLAPEPADIAGIPHPRIGYSGHLKKQLDWNLLLDLSSRHPEWSFVFVGAANAHPEIAAPIEQLSRRPNVRFLGSKTVEQLAAYPQYFDVCIMPYVQDNYTKYIYPLKLHEYLASGRPVVGTPIESLKKFSDVVRLPETPEQWSSDIADSLCPASNSAESSDVRQNLARQHDWKTIVRQIAEAMALRLGFPYSERFTRQLAAETSENLLAASVARSFSTWKSPSRESKLRCQMQLNYPSSAPDWFHEVVSPLPLSRFFRFRSHAPIAALGRLLTAILPVNRRKREI